jgi:hypothetical protein
MSRNHVFDSNGPDMRLRGTAQQLFEKYLQLGRDATGSGDRVMAESYFQHAEHYFRIINAMNQVQQQQGGQQQQPRRYQGGPEGGEGEGGGDQQPDLNGHGQNGQSYGQQPGNGHAESGQDEDEPQPQPGLREREQL